MKEKVFAIALMLVVFADAVAQIHYSSSKVVDLGLSVKWAGYNLGADSPEEMGGHYAWADVTGTGNSPFTCQTISGNMNICGDSRYDIARTTWGGSWRLPTASEFEELLKKCTCMIVRNNSGIWGLWCKGPNGNAIFFLLAGEGGKDGGTLSINTNGWYWSGTTITSSLRDFYGHTNSYARALSAVRSIYGTMSFSMFDAAPSSRFSVRPVYDSSSTISPQPTNPTPSSSNTQQGFNFLKEQIGKWKELRNGTFAEGSGAGVVLFGNNGYAYTGNTPDALKNKIVELNKANSNIEDVCVTEQGKFVIIFDNYGYQTSAGCPQELLNALYLYNARHEKIVSVALDDSGRWALVGENNFNSAMGIFSDIKAAIDKYGRLYSVSLANSGALLSVCEHGVAWNNLVPNNVTEEIKKAKFGVRYVKFTANGKFIITDGNTVARYNM